jgi:hypothetical protein
MVLKSFCVVGKKWCVNPQPEVWCRPEVWCVNRKRKRHHKLLPTQQLWVDEGGGGIVRLYPPHVHHPQVPAPAQRPVERDSLARLLQKRDRWLLSNAHSDGTQPPSLPLSLSRVVQWYGELTAAWGSQDAHPSLLLEQKTKIINN